MGGPPVAILAPDSVVVCVGGLGWGVWGTPTYGLQSDGPVVLSILRYEGLSMVRVQCLHRALAAPAPRLPSPSVPWPLSGGFTVWHV